MTNWIVIAAYAALAVAVVLCIVALPLWLALSDRFLGTNFYGLGDAEMSRRERLRSAWNDGPEAKIVDDALKTLGALNVPSSQDDTQ